MEDSRRIQDSGYSQGDSEKRRVNYSVIQRASKTGSSSCQCSTTLQRMQKEMKK